jgi:DNA repair photolyase
MREIAINAPQYKYPMGLTSQFYFCGMPFRLDSYKDCPSQCIYCYVASRHGNFSNVAQYANPHTLEKWFQFANRSLNSGMNIILECIKRRMPVHFGGMSDPFLIPTRFRYITLSILKILDRHNYPTLISTKADLTECKEFADVILGKPHFAIQISFSTFDDGVAALVEPNAPSPSRRLSGAIRAMKNGNWVACRLQPYIPFQRIDELVSFINSCGFAHLTIEHLKLPFDKKIDLKTLSSAFDIDILKLFPKGDRIKLGREFEMPTELRFQEIKKFLAAASKYRISLGIGDNGFQHYSTSPCCCGIDSLPAFQNWFNHNATVAIIRARRKGEIEYSSIANEWAPEGNIARMINSKTRLKDTHNSVRNHIRRQWLTDGQHSPSMFHNVTAVKLDGKYHYYFDKTL